jgi:hypothetical protein
MRRLVYASLFIFLLWRSSKFLLLVEFGHCLLLAIVLVRIRFGGMDWGKTRSVEAWIIGGLNILIRTDAPHASLSRVVLLAFGVTQVHSFTSLS